MTKMMEIIASNRIILLMVVKIFLYIISLLFRTMIVMVITHLLSTIISIPKDLKGSLSKSDNYRGISLVTSICKLFDYIIIILYDKQLKTTDMQFRFKSNHSTTMCSAIYMDIINQLLMYIVVCWKPEKILTEFISVHCLDCYKNAIYQLV